MQVGPVSCGPVWGYWALCVGSRVLYPTQGVGFRVLYPPPQKKSDATKAWIKEAGRMNHLKHIVP